MGVLRWQTTAAIFFLFTGSAVAQDMGTMASVFQRAMEYQAVERLSALRQEASNERLGLSSRLIVGTPSVTLSQKSDRWNKDIGEQEDALGLSVSLWRWGERQAAIKAARSEIDSAHAESNAIQLGVASQVRDGVWGFLRESLRDQLLANQLEEAKKTEHDALRRFEAGEVSRVDWLSAKMATQSIQTSLIEQRSRRVKADRQLRAVTGLSSVQMGLGSEIIVSTSAISRLAETLPNLNDRQAVLDASVDYRWLKAKVRHAQDRLRLIQERGSGSPTLSLESTRSRSASGEPFGRTMTLSISVPFGGGGQQRADVADITAALVRDEQELLRYQKTFEFGWQASLDLIGQRQLAQELANQRVVDSSVVLQALIKASEAGEVEYMERLRAERQAFESQIAAIEADVDYRQAISDFLQSIGRVPGEVTKP
jgi:cobalt-zinc-cadmium efflux system outer membrane protein